MGRNIPSKEIITASIHPLLSLAISITWIAALVATISSLCGIWSKKSSKSSSKTNTKTTAKTIRTTTNEQKPSSSSKGKATNSTDVNNATSATAMNDDDEATNKPLPPPPSAAKLEFGESAVIKKMEKSSSLKNYVSKTTSTRRKLSSSISMKVSMKIRDKASDFKDKASGIKDKASDNIKGKASDIIHRKKNDSESLWTKRIILGEKCKLPNEDHVNEVVVSNNDDDDDDDDNSNGVTSSGSAPSRAMSRSVSCVSGESVSSVRRKEEKLRRDCKGKGKEKVQSDEEDDS